MLGNVNTLHEHPKEAPIHLLDTNCPLFLLFELCPILFFLLFTCDIYFKYFRFIFWEVPDLGGFYNTLVVWVIGFEYMHLKATQEANNTEQWITLYWKEFCAPGILIRMDGTEDLF